MRTPTLSAFALLLLAASPIGCDDPEESMPLACRAQTYRYSEYTGATRGCTCHDTSFTEDEEPKSVCQGLYDALFDASYSAGGSNREYSFVTSAPGLSCEEIVTDPCDNTEY